MELRVLAFLSQDPLLLAALQDRRDVLRSVARKLYYLDDGAVVSDQQRKEAKTAVYGILYGCGVGTLAARLGVSLAAARDVVDGFFRAFPGVQAWKQRQLHLASNSTVRRVWTRG